MEITIEIDDKWLKEIETEARKEFRSVKAQVEYLVNKHYELTSSMRTQLGNLEKARKKINKSEETEKVLKQL